jgi:hypothetical protein
MCCRSCCGSASPELADEVELPAPLLQNLAMVPSYYLRYFYAHDRVLEEQRHEPPRAEKVMEVERELLRLYADPSVDAKPAVLERGGAFYSEAAVDLIASLLSDRGDVQVANLRNGGTLPFLPDDHVVEVSATIGASGPVAVPASAGTTQGLIGHVAGYERLALDAARHTGSAERGRRLVERAARPPARRPVGPRGEARRSAHRPQPGSPRVGAVSGTAVRTGQDFRRRTRKGSSSPSTAAAPRPTPSPWMRPVRSSPMWSGRVRCAPWTGGGIGRRRRRGRPAVHAEAGGGRC